MSSSPYMPLYVGDYLRDTRRLTTKEHGAYILLLMELWQHGGEIEEAAGDIQRITGLTKDEYRTVWRKKLRPFFTITGDKIRHKRVDEEIERRAKMVQKRCKAGAKGGRKTQQKQREAQALAQASQAKGLAITPYGVNSQSLAPDGALALERLRAACANSGHQTIEIERLAGAIEGWGDGVYYVTGRYAADTFTERLGPVLRAENIRLEPIRKPALKAIAGDKS